MKTIIENSSAGSKVEKAFAQNLKELLVSSGLADGNEVDVQLDKTSKYLDDAKENAKTFLQKGKKYIIVHIGRSNTQSDVVLVDLNNAAMQAFEVKSSYDFSKLFNPSLKTDFASRSLVGTGLISKKTKHMDAVCQIISDTAMKDKMFKDFMSIMAKHSIDFPCSKVIPQFKDAFEEFVQEYPIAFKKDTQSIVVSRPVFSNKIDDICYSYYMRYADAIGKVPTPYMQIGNVNKFGMVNAQIFQIAKDDGEIPILKLQSNGTSIVKKLSDFFGGFIIRLRLRTRGGNLNADEWRDPTQFNLVAELNFAKEPFGSLCNLIEYGNFPVCKLV